MQTRQIPRYRTEKPECTVMRIERPMMISAPANITKGSRRLTWSDNHAMTMHKPNAAANGGTEWS